MRGILSCFNSDEGTVQFEKLKLLHLEPLTLMHLVRFFIFLVYSLRGSPILCQWLQ